MKAIKELKKLSSVTEMGLTYSDFQKVLVEAKPVVDESLSEILDGSLRKALSEIMAAYADSGRFWNSCVTKLEIRPGWFPFTKEETDQFIPYQIPWNHETLLGERTGRMAGHASMVTNMWRFASARLVEAEQIVKQPNVKTN